MIEFGTKVSDRAYIHRNCAYAVIINESGLVAVIEQSKGYFLIGGGIDDLEDPVSALKRESIEETGMTLKVLEKIGEAADHDSHLSDGGVSYSRSSVFYKAQLLEKVCEAVELDHLLKWIPPEDALQGLFFEGQKWALKQALNSC